MLGSTVEQLRTLALAADDASGHFPAMYARVTRAVDEAIAAGRFGDGTPDGTVREAFAAWYLRAVNPPTPAAGAAPVPPVPKCWRAAFDVAGDGRLLIVQQLLLGMNGTSTTTCPRSSSSSPGPRGPHRAAPRLRCRERHPRRDVPGHPPGPRHRCRAGSTGSPRSAGDGSSTSRSTVARDQAWRAATPAPRARRGRPRGRRRRARPARHRPRLPRHPAPSAGEPGWSRSPVGARSTTPAGSPHGSSVRSPDASVPRRPRREPGRIRRGCTVL